MQVSEIIEKLQKAAKDLLETTGFVKVIKIRSEFENLKKSGFRPDLAFMVQVREQDKYVLIFEIKSLGQPRYVRMAANQLQSFIRKKQDFYAVFGAPFVSEESRQICKEEGIGFIDLAGNCFFKFDNVYLSAEGRPNPYPGTRPLKSIFSSKSTRVLRILLKNPKKSWLLKDLAEVSKISIGQASNIKKRLSEYEMIKEKDVGKRTEFWLSNPQTLLSKWENYYTYRSNKIKNYSSLEDVKVIEDKLADYFKANNIPYAFTLASGASRIAPFLRYNRVFCYVDGPIESIAEDLKLKEVISGPNVSLLLPYDGGVFYGLQEIQNLKVVSDVQLYLDLKNYKERGEEAANFILNERLKKQWSQDEPF